MKRLITCFLAALLLCGLLFAQAAVASEPLESEMVQVGGNEKGMVTHSVYADYDTLYRLAPALGLTLRELPKAWNGYELIAVMLSLRPGDNPPAIIRPDREPDRIEMGENGPFSLWNVPAGPFLHAIGAVHVYYAKDMEDFFALTITTQDWVADPVQEANGMHLIGLNDEQVYEAIDQLHPASPGEDGQQKYVLYKTTIYDEGVTTGAFEELLISLPF